MPQMRSVKFLTGAPLAQNLDWSQEELTMSLLPCFTTETFPGRANYPQSAYQEPAWRAISLGEEALPNEYVQFRDPQYLQFPVKDTTFSDEETSFLDRKTLSFVSCATSSDGERSFVEEEEILTQYYNQSIAAHEDVPSSQIEELQSLTDMSFSTTSTDVTDSFFEASLETPPKSFKLVPVSGPLSDLKDIPNSAYLRSINPQTMTVNIIVGIISMPQARIIQGRRGGRTFELVEMLVADETKAGFGINLWLPPVDHNEGNLRAMATSLRPRDIVLVRNVALASYRNNVYGQSLRKDTTKLDLMYREPVDRFDITGLYNSKELENATLHNTQMIKVKRAKDWVMQFISGGVNRGKDRSKRTGSKAKIPNDLPPDSP